MKIMMKRPGKPWEYRDCLNNLKDLQSLVGGYIEVVPFSREAAIICNEEGRLLKLPHNCKVDGVDYVGTILAVGVAGEDFDSITENHYGDDLFIRLVTED